MRLLFILVLIVLASLGAYFALRGGGADPGATGPDGRPASGRVRPGEAPLEAGADPATARDPAIAAGTREPGAGSAAAGPGAAAEEPAPWNGAANSQGNPAILDTEVRPDADLESKYAKYSPAERRGARDAILEMLQAEGEVQDENARLSSKDVQMLKREVEWLDMHSDD